MLRFLASLTIVVSLAAVAEAHFPWLSTNEEGKLVLFFSEGINERDYHAPACVQNASVTLDGESGPVGLELLESEGFTGMVSGVTPAADASAHTSIEYGVYHGTMLRYEASRAPLGEERPSAAADLDATIAAHPWRTDDGLKVLVTWQGEPLGGAEVMLTDSEGDASSAKTNKYGVAKFAAPAAGEVGLFAGHTVKDAAGKFGEDDYTSESYYLTLTTTYDTGEHAMPSEEPTAVASDYPELPTPIASFGAAVSDGWLYVYSGHTGTEHEHSRDNLSKHFCRLQIDGGQAWEELPMGETLQGLPLLAHGGKLYRVGGVHSRNAADETEDMHSTDTFACYDPASNKWTDLAPLPEARSSHDAVVIGDSIFVVGGWNLSGESPGEWSKTALRFDLNAPESGWQEVAAPPFARRALAAAHLDGKLVVIGGMQREAGVTNKVAAYDPASDSWSDLPALPGKGISGFGVSAWSLADGVYASGMQGVVYRLAPGAEEWSEAGKLADPRFFHRLVPGPDGALLVVAGASAQNGHVGTVEQVEVEAN